MDDTMAPPAKRRRILGSAKNVLQQSEVPVKKAGAAFYHGVEHLDAAPSAKPRVTPSRIDEIHLEIRKRALDEYVRMHRRQGTAVASDIASSATDVVVSVAAAVNADGSTTALSTTSATADYPDAPSTAATSTTTAAVSDSASATSSSPATSTDSSSSSGLTSDAAPSTSASDSSTPTATGSATPTSSASLASTTDSSATNNTITTSTSESLIAGTNLTTSATTITDSSSTFTSQSTFDLASLTSSSSRSQSTITSSSSSSFGAGILILATLDDGDVATLTRSDRPYTTTLADSRVTTISPPSSSPSSSRHSTASASESAFSDESVSAVSTISTGPSSARSTVFSTYTPSPTQDSGSTVTEAIGAAGIGQESATSAAASSTSTAGSGSGGGGGSTTPPAGTIAGGVVGGAAGLAVVLLVAMLFLRWYRRRASAGHQALPPNSAGLSQDMDPAPTSRGSPGMAERAGLMPFVGAVPALFRHQNRSRDSTAETGERGFTRVSGRKLPSAFSEGMTALPSSTASPPPTMPLVSDRSMSEHSFYRDSQGFYGGDGNGPASPNPFSDLTPINTNIASQPGPDGLLEQPIISPGPQRRPTVHAGGPYVMSPNTVTSETRHMLSPTSPPWTGGSQGTFNRSETPTSLEGSRGSKFMEEV